MRDVGGPYVVGAFFAEWFNPEANGPGFEARVTYWAEPRAGVRRGDEARLLFVVALAGGSGDATIELRIQVPDGTHRSLAREAISFRDERLGWARWSVPI